MQDKYSHPSRKVFEEENLILDLSKAVFIDPDSFSSMSEFTKFICRELSYTPGKRSNKAIKIPKPVQGHVDLAEYPERLLAYVVNQGSNTVSVVDILSLEKITDINVGNNPFGLDISPSKRYIYVSNGNDDTLSVIRTSDNRVVDTIKLNTGTFTADDPSGVKVSPDGRYVYVANFLSKNISVVDAAERRVIDTIPMPSNPILIDITKDGLLAYITLSDDRKAAVVDLSTNLFLKTLPIETELADIRISPTKPLAFVSNFYFDNIIAINTKIAESSPDSIPAGDGVFGLAFSPDGRTLYAANYNADTITVIDVFTHTPLFNIPAGNGNGPRSIQVTPDGRFLVVSNYDIGTLSIISTRTNQIIGTVAVGKRPYNIVILDTGCSTDYISSYKCK